MQVSGSYDQSISCIPDAIDVSITDIMHSVVQVR